jgi:hypothetical protein
MWNILTEAIDNIDFPVFTAAKEKLNCVIQKIFNKVITCKIIDIFV